MQLLIGKTLADDLQQQLFAAHKAQLAIRQDLRAPHLAAIFVGNNPASAAYIRNKIRACEQAGFTSTLLRFDESISQAELLAQIQELNQRDDVDGFIVQLPLPAHIDEQSITFAVNPDKDVDGFHPFNLGKMMLGVDTFVSATPLGILTILSHYGIDTQGKHCVVVGRSNIVGTPISVLLSRNSRPVGNCTVTLTHSRTADLAAETRRADILIAAIGKPNFITADMVKDGVVVIDVGINSVEDSSSKSGYRLVGDVDFDGVSAKASAITPVPRGVGPMTVAALLLNTWKSYCKKFDLVSKI
jgi:methylenetetrahydrofolate dehydrogenase (NADP+) / methenyltetrahydrofolate cyclohydrolase